MVGTMRMSLTTTYSKRHSASVELRGGGRGKEFLQPSAMSGVMERFVELLLNG